MCIHVHVFVCCMLVVGVCICPYICIMFQRELSGNQKCHCSREIHTYFEAVQSLVVNVNLLYHHYTTVITPFNFQRRLEASN